MPEIKYDIQEEEKKRITKKEAIKVLNKIKEMIKDLPCDLVFAGGFTEKDESFHDIDLSLIQKGEKLNPCVCRTVVERFRSFEPKYPLDIYCEICGATMQWRGNYWQYIYNPTMAPLHINWRKVRGARRGLNLFEFCELEKRVEAIEKFIMKDYGCESHDFLQIGDFKPVSYVRVKKINLLNDKMVEVILENEGREFSFSGGIFEVLPNMKKILVHWRDTVIPRILALEKMSKKEIEELIKKCEGMKV
jgi:hypothetical protein